MRYDRVNSKGEVLESIASPTFPVIPTTSGEQWVQVACPEDSQVFPEGIEVPAIVWPNAADGGHDWQTTVVDGVAITTQISASPRKTPAEIKALVESKMAQVKSIKNELPTLLKSSSIVDIRKAVIMIAEILNLV